jgi:hypothetical protein
LNYCGLHEATWLGLNDLSRVGEGKLFGDFSPLVLFWLDDAELSLMDPDLIDIGLVDMLSGD